MIMRCRGEAKWAGFEGRGGGTVGIPAGSFSGLWGNDKEKEGKGGSRWQKKHEEEFQERFRKKRSQGEEKKIFGRIGKRPPLTSIKHKERRREGRKAGAESKDRKKGFEGSSLKEVFIE